MSGILLGKEALAISPGNRGHLGILLGKDRRGIPLGKGNDNNDLNLLRKNEK